MATSEEQIEQFATLPTEARNPRSTALDQLPTLELLQVINDEDATIAAAVRAASVPQVAQAVEAIVARFAQGGRLFYVGAGTSGRLGVLGCLRVPAHLLGPARPLRRPHRRRRSRPPHLVRSH